MLPYYLKENVGRFSRRLVIHHRPSSQPLSSIGGVGSPSFAGTRDASNPCVVVRCYSNTPRRLDEASEGDSKKPPFTKAEKRAAALDYNSRRAAYRRQVSLLRKQYFDEIAQERAEEEARAAAEKRETTRKMLERQRLKNIRSAQNALRQEEKRLARQREFEEYLRVKQDERDDRKRRYTKARKMVIAELEAEADLWLTTPEEVDAAFTHEAEQLLWARPNGVLGAPSPSVDSHFWQYESHTMHLDKTFKTPRELLLEKLEAHLYEEAMVDENFWTPERVKDCEELEQKAKLRAMVRAAGRRSLLERQKDMLMSYFGTTKDEIPKRMPAPNVKVLANVKAQEKEGVQMLLKDPTKFFRFEKETLQGTADGGAYSGPSLGAPIDLKDPLRDGTPWKGVFPIGIAKLPKADTRTQREKKRQEREQKMWEAAQAEKLDEDTSIELAASDTVFDAEEPIDYDNNPWDSDDEEWEKGLDPIEDADLLQTPPEERYTEDDIRWAISQLELKSDYLHTQMTKDMDSTLQRLRTQREDGNETEEEQSLQNILLSLSNEQMRAIVEVDSQDLNAMSPDELSEALSQVPGLEEEQVKRILELDDSLDGGEPDSKPSSDEDPRR